MLLAGVPPGETPDADAVRVLAPESEVDVVSESARVSDVAVVSVAGPASGGVGERVAGPEWDGARPSALGSLPDGAAVAAVKPPTAVAGPPRVSSSPVPPDRPRACRPVPSDASRLSDR
jgi:hypothetical protein